jgi:hypothetical protein
MKILREVTVWSGEWIRPPNHVYLIENNYIYGYQKYGYGEPIYFKKRMQFDNKNRKFEEINKNSPNNPFKDFQRA